MTALGGVAAAAPKISVVIVSFDRPTQLAAALKTLSAQVLPREQFEVIIVDNGSNPETAQVCQAYLAQFRHWRFCRQPRPGAAAARNAGVAQSGGEIILFLDDDIRAEPELLSRHVAAHKDFPDCAVLGHVSLPWSEPRRPWEQALANHPELFQSFDFPNPHDVPFTHFYTCNVSMRRSFFERNPGFDESFTSSGFEDTELGYRFCNSDGKLVYDAAASAQHDVRTSFQAFKRKRYSSGKWLAHLLGIHPELKEFFVSGRERPHTKLLAIMGNLLAPLYEAQLSAPIRRVLAQFCWLSWQKSFWEGFAAERERSLIQ